MFLNLANCCHVTLACYLFVLGLLRPTFIHNKNFSLNLPAAVAKRQSTAETKDTGSIPAVVATFQVLAITPMCQKFWRMLQIPRWSE